MYLCPVVYILVGECKHVCVSHTVKALLVDYSAAGQGFIVLLVTHQRVHAQDGWKKRRRLKNEHFLRKKRIEKEKAREQCWHWVDLLIGLQPYTRPPCTSRFQHRNQGKHEKEKKKERKKKTCTLYGFSSCVLALTSATTADLLLLAGWSQINVQDTLFVIKKIMRYQPAKAKNLWCALAAGNLKYVSSQAVTLRTQLTENICLVSLSERLRVSDCLFDYWMQWSACIATS